MSGLIEEIQRDAFDETVPISRLLRKVKAAASKLSLPPTEKWVEQELSGYHEDPPQYRKLTGKPQALNPYQGWVPIMMATDSDNKLISDVTVRQSVASLEALLADNETSFVQFPLPTSFIRMLNKTADFPVGTMAVHIATSQVHGLLDAVRTLALEWALSLERAGIKGEGVSFNSEEKKLATASTIFNIGSIGSMVGNLGIGNASGAISSTGISGQQINALLQQLGPHVAALKTDGGDGAAIDKSIYALTELAKSQSPDQRVARSVLGDLRNALSGAAGNLIASGAISMIARILGA